MIQKIKKPVSILLTVLMVFSVFAVVPFAASAAELADYVMVENLRVGDILGGDVRHLANYGNYTLTLEANRYGDYFGKKTEATVTSSFDFAEAQGSDPVSIYDMNGYNRYYPYDENGNRCEAFIVTAVDHSARTFSLAGYREPDNPVLLNSSVKYRYCDGTAFHTGNTPAASTYKVDTGNRKWTNNSWYVVTENVTFEKRIEITGTVNLVLCDGATLTAKQGISVNKGDYNPSGAGALNIYAQNGGTGALYAGTANGTSTTMKDNPQRAAIGGDDNNTNGDITIHGGNIYAISNVGTAGIGGGQNRDGGNVTIYGGNVTAGNQNSYGSGIGGGYYANAGNINILGGTVTAFATGLENDAAFGTIETDRTVNLTIPEGATMVAGDNADSAVATTVDEYKANRKAYARVEAGKLPDYYTVDWKNDDGSILKTKEFAAGTTPTYDGETPTKPDDAQHTYTFTGWTPAITAATADAIYTATFSPCVASVTSNGTTTKYADFGTAVSNWTDGSTLTLLADVTTSSTINVYDGTKTFDLNGYGIRRDGTDRIFNIAYSRTLTMNDSNPDRVHYITLSNYSGVSVSDTGTEAEVVNGNGVVKVNGGYLTGAAFSYGGCICLDNGCHFIMNAGTIIGNTSSNSGAVRMNKGGTFTMNGGQIIYNLGPVGAVNREDNGSSVFEVSGASVIKNNYNSSGNSRNVFVNAGSINKVTGSLKDGAEIGVNMTSGTGVFTNTDSDKINYNDPTKFFSDNSNYGVFKNANSQLELKTAYTVTWKNGETVLKTEKVAKDTSPKYTGAPPTKEDDDNAYTFTGWKNGETTYAPDAALPAVTGDITYTATFTATPYVASVTSNDTTTKYTDFGTAVSEWTDGSTLKLLANVTTSSVIHFTSGVKTLDLNGYGIKNTSANYEASNSVIYIRGSGTQLTLQDSRPNETTHYFTAPAGNAGLATDISDIDSGDQQSFHGGYLTGGNCFSGGGIRVDNGANLIMTGGTIIGNRGQYGGGIDVEKSGSAGGSATISGGAIMYNYGTNYNGAIHTNGANYVSVSNCKITNNYAEHGAGGAYKSSINGGFSGNMVVKDNKTGNNECNIVLGDNERISLSSALGDDAYIGITMSNPGVFTNSAETANNDASKFKSDDASYTVGKNADGQLYLYKSLIAGHSLSLDGNIGINFYLDPSVAGLTAQQVTADKLSYTFAWADVETTKAKVNVAEQANQKNFSIETINGVDYIKVTCYVCAAEMTCDVDASFTLGDKTESKTYSVREYCDSVIKATPAQIDGLFGGTEKYNKLVGLVKAMLHYGAMAQTKFKVNTGYLANNKVDYNPGDVDGDMLDTAIAAANGTDKAANMNDVAATLGAKWFSTSLIYLDDSTLRHYFVKATDTFKPSDYTDNKSNYYYYVEKTGIPAAELDKLQSFTAGSQTFKYSALDFVKGMITSSADGNSKNLAKSLYWYNQAANNYFD